MTWVDLDTLPAALKRIADAAVAVGWAVTATVAEGPPPTVALRFAHGEWRAYSVWRLDKGVNWTSAASRHIPPGKFSTLGAFKMWLGIA